MTRFCGPWTRAAILLAVAAFSGQPATAEDFYKGKTINFVIGSAPTGAGYDAYARLLAIHLGHHLAGRPSVIPQNMPGAGSIRATNYLYSVAPKDGTSIGMIDQAIYLSQMLGTPELKADTLKFNWVGRIGSNNAVLFAWHTAPVKRIEDALTTELIVSASGTASRLNWTLLNSVVGTKIKIITGYKSASEGRLAVARGEVHGVSSPWFEIKVQEHEWLENKSINLLLQTGTERAADLQNVPRMTDLAKNEDDRLLLHLFSLPNSVGRSVLAPPDMRPDRVAELRAAFSAAMSDPALLADAQRARLDLEPLSGEELQLLVTANSNFPVALIQRARDIVEQARQIEP
jgi:tripartite-type tricarboxylate transporter receptor subunit TctC